MNITSIEHFKSVYPNEDIKDFDTIYYTSGGEDIFAFILVKGQMEDIKVFTHGNYSEASLENKIFALISKYGKKSDNNSLKDETLEDSEENLIRYDLLFPKRERIGETASSLLFAIGMSVFEALPIIILYFMNIKIHIVLIIAFCCLVINVIMFFIFKKKTPRKKADDL